MLRQAKTTKSSETGGHFAIIASKYNARYVNSMLNAARGVLRKAGAASVKVVRVPGAYEIPVVAARLAERPTPPLAGIICLGVILRGQTCHAQLIGEAITSALMRLQIQHGIPVVHEVLLLENAEQAVARCLDPKHNRGLEAAQTAVEMAGILRSL
jgi:6,7-dimethyl-8-ribityllumazine synthase